MFSSESNDIAAVVDRFSLEIRKRLRESVLFLADVYRLNGAQSVPLDEMRKQYREAHQNEPGSVSTNEPPAANVIPLCSRRR